MYRQADSAYVKTTCDVRVSVPEVQRLESGGEEGALQLGRVCGPVSQSSKPLEALPTVCMHAGKQISTQIGRQDTVNRQVSKRAGAQAAEQAAEQWCYRRTMHAIVLGPYAVYVILH